MNGIEKCLMFRQIRRVICEKNGIPFIEPNCPHPDPDCIGTCPRCDRYLDRINSNLERMRLDGKTPDLSGIDSIYRSNLADLISESDLRRMPLEKELGRTVQSLIDETPEKWHSAVIRGAYECLRRQWPLHTANIQIAARETAPDNQ